MKKSAIKKAIKEYLKANKPQQTPYNPDVETAEPGTETKPVRRRTLTPPTEAPDSKPKAQNEEEEMDLANKIGKRFSKLSKDKLDENTVSRMQKLAGIITEGCNNCQKKLKEIKINKPGGKNRTLYFFLNNNIKDFAKHELERNPNALLQVVADAIDEEIDDNTEFSGLDPNIQQQLIDYLVEAGLEYHGEWESEEDDEEMVYGVTWNVDDFGLVYNWTDEAEPGSYDWSEVEFKGRKFYSLSYDI